MGPGDRPVLIDFGASSAPHVGTYEGTEGYVAPDLRLGQDRKYSEDGDLYALAVTLREWLTGSRTGDDSSCFPDIPVHVIECLSRATASEANLRFSSAQSFREALVDATSRISAPPVLAEPVTIDVDEAIEEVERVSVVGITITSDVVSDPNPFVPYLNSLHSRTAETDSALAESQARNPLFRFIHVPHPLAGAIKAILAGSTRRHVIVTGHAGDGKSTIAVELLKTLTGLPFEQTLPVALSPRTDLLAGQIPISVIKDLSEWSPAERAGLLEEMLSPAGRRFFVISNTGTLLDAFKAREDVGDWMRIESDLLGAMSSSTGTDLEFGTTSFCVFNVAMMDNLSIAEKIFERMIAADRWNICRSVECRHVCPIFKNIALIQANQSVVAKRLFLAYRRMYEYGTRLTLRQLSAHMAYMITSGLGYSEVIRMSQRAVPPPVTEYMFFNRFFGDNGSAVDSPVLQLRAIRAVREQGFGERPCPSWERQLWSKSQGQAFRLRAASVPDHVEALREDGATRSPSSPHSREQLRRAVFFLHDFDDSDGTFLTSFLKSMMILDFSRWQLQASSTLGLRDTAPLHRRIMHVLQEHFSGVRLPEDVGSDRQLFVTLSRRSHDVRQSAQVVLARCPEDVFQVKLVQRDNAAGAIRRELVLDGSGRSPHLVLPLGLPFLDYVVMRNQGEVGRILGASYVDRLERFKGQLISSSVLERSDDIMLVRLRTNNTFRRQIFSIRGDRLEVTDG